jgi:hypothetical protein
MKHLHNMLECFESARNNYKELHARYLIASSQKHIVSSKYDEAQKSALKAIGASVARTINWYFTTKELEHSIFEDIKSRFEQEVLMVVKAMVDIRLCEAPSDENTPCKILDSFVDNTHQDIAGELAVLLSIVLDSEEKNNFRTWRTITAQLISSEVFTLSYFNQGFKLRRHLPVMLGAVTGSDGAVTHVGASSNFPPPEFRTREYFEKERKRRNDYFGKPVIEIDQKIQAGINSKSTSPLDKLSEEECQQRNKLELQNWIIFRCSAEENLLHLNHWEPRCSKYFLYHLNKTDWV